MGTIDINGKDRIGKRLVAHNRKQYDAPLLPRNTGAAACENGNEANQTQDLGRIPDHPIPRAERFSGLRTGLTGKPVADNDTVLAYAITADQVMDTKIRRSDKKALHAHGRVRKTVWERGGRKIVTEVPSSILTTIYVVIDPKIICEVFAEVFFSATSRSLYRNHDP